MARKQTKAEKEAQAKLVIGACVGAILLAIGLCSLFVFHVINRKDKHYYFEKFSKLENGLENLTNIEKSNLKQAESTLQKIRKTIFGIEKVTVAMPKRQDGFFQERTNKAKDLNIKLFKLKSLEQEMLHKIFYYKNLPNDRCEIKRVLEQNETWIKRGYLAMPLSIIGVTIISNSLLLGLCAASVVGSGITMFSIFNAFKKDSDENEIIQNAESKLFD